MERIRVHDKEFIPYLSEQTIQDRIAELAQQISADFKDRNVLFLGILNGSFIFAADLFKRVSIPAAISFIKLVSYKGTSSTGTVITSIGLEEDLSGKDVIIVEDIVDTGKTLTEFLPSLVKQNPNSVRICTLLQKPEALQYPLDVDYIGFSIPNKFVVGYGLDYDGLGRNYAEIFQLAE
ncbi:MAG: hypoxanthine phosphoribosyltransferase [Chitinophagaceae bacterium]|nr:hypoxanthine phosphoribosyltransferase [Chitinophagaceae bacterium]